MTQREITREQISFLEELLDGYVPTYSRMVENYSGRGMGGRDCLGVVIGDVSHVAAATVAVALALDEHEHVRLEYDAFDIMEMVTTGRIQYVTDNLGYDTIVYWPHLSVQPERGEE